MIGGIHQHSDVELDGRSHILWPETGGVRFILEVVLIYHLVTIAIPLLISQIELLNPTFVPEPLRSILYTLLWLGIGGSIGWLYLTGSLVSRYEVGDSKELPEFLSQDISSDRWTWIHGGMVVVGGLLVVVTYAGFVEAFLSVVDMLVIVVGEFEWPLTVVDGVYVAGFLGGFLSFAIGMDRLMVYGLRSYVRQRLDLQ